MSLEQDHSLNLVAEVDLLRVEATLRFAQLVQDLIKPVFLEDKSAKLEPFEADRLPVDKVETTTMRTPTPPYKPIPKSAPRKVSELPVLLAPTKKVDLNHWWRSAKCLGMDREEFFVTGAEQNRVKLFCKNCPVIKRCLVEALKHDHKGVWGGTTERERRAAQKRRAYLQIAKQSGAT